VLARALSGVTVLAALGSCALPAYEVTPGGSGAKGGAGIGGLVDFPLAVRLEADPDLLARASPDGTDIRFVDENGLPLAHEIERYASAQGSLTAWVSVAQIAAVDDTTVYLVYGDGAAQAPSASEVWDDRFAGVWHLAEPDGTTFFADGSPANHAGFVPANSTPPNAAEGVMAGARSFDGDEDRVSMGDHDDLDFDATTSFSYSAWVQQAPNANTFDSPLHKGGGSASNEGYAFYLGSGSWSTSISDGLNNVSSTLLIDSTGIAEWKHVLAVVDRQEDLMHAYLDGARIGSTSIASLGSLGSSVPLQLGSLNSTYAGSIDEVRIYRMVVSESWARAEVLSVLGDAAFVTVGTEEPVPSN